MSRQVLEDSKETRVYYQVNFEDGGSLAPRIFDTLKEAQDCIETADNLGSKSEWIITGKEESSYEYWREVYETKAYLTQEVRTTYRIS